MFDPLWLDTLRQLLFRFKPELNAVSDRCPCAFPFLISALPNFISGDKPRRVVVLDSLDGGSSRLNRRSSRTSLGLSLGCLFQVACVQNTTLYIGVTWHVEDSQIAILQIIARVND